MDVLVGIDLSSGKPPSPIQLFRLASNRKFNREVQSVMQELEKAGIDISSQVSTVFIVLFARRL